MSRYIFYSVLFIVSALPAWSQTLTGGANKIGNKQHINTMVTTKAVEGQTIYQDALIRERRAYLKQLQERALNLVAVRRDLRCCQLIGVILPWGNDMDAAVNKGRTYIKTKDYGTVTAGKSTNLDNKANISINNKNSSFSAEEIAEIMRMAAEKEAQQGARPYATEGNR